MDNLVFRGADNQALTNSLLVAEKFGKNHQHVLRDIRELIDGINKDADAKVQNWTQTNNQQVNQMFTLIEYDIPMPTGGIKKAPMYVMNRDGFTLLVMGFTGRKAFRFKLAYIAAFNAMEKVIKEEYTRALSSMDQRIKVIEERRASFEGLPAPSEELPKMSQRDCIRSLVNKIAWATNTNQSNIWHKVYNHLYYRYHISIRSYKKKYPEENNLDIAERNGLLPRIYTIVSNMYDLIG